MMSVLIECGEDAVALSSTLAALVPGAVEGLVREVLIVDRGLDAATRTVADHAGCRIAAAGEAHRAVAAAKGEWIMLLEPGARLSAGWIEAVAEHIAVAAVEGSSHRAARFSPARDGGPFACLRFRRPSAVAHGLVLPKAQAIDLYGGRRVGRLATRRLSAAIRPRGTAAR